MTYMSEPQPATPYEGNAATTPVRLLAYRLARAEATPEETLRDPEIVLTAGRTAWVRLLGTGSAAFMLFLAFFIHHGAWLGTDMGSMPRLALWILSVGFIDTLLFFGHSAATTSTNVEIQWDCLKWTEGVEIGQLAWADLRETWLWHEPVEGESAVEQARRGGRRLLLIDNHGQRLYIPEQDASFDALVARVRLERPDVPTQVVEPESPREVETEGEPVGDPEADDAIESADPKDAPADDASDGR
jgi:hypothetical protein